MKIIAKIIFILVFTTVACTNKEKKSEPLTVLRVGSGSVTDPEIYHIKNGDLFKKNGLNAKVEYIIGGRGSVLMEMFLAGKIDVATFGDLPAILGWLKGVDIKAVAAFPRSRRDTWIMVADTQKIKTMQDLKGKKISVQIGSGTQFWLFLSLEQAGMTVNDVKMLNVPGGDASVALMTKEIDAAVMSEPSISNLEEKKVAFKLKGSVCTKTNSHLLLVSGKLYRDHPEVIKSIIATFKETNSWIIDNPDKTVSLIGSKITYKALPKNVLKRQYGQNLSKVKYLGFTDSTKLSFKQIVSFLRDLKAVAQHGTLVDSIEKFYDTRFVDEYYLDKAKREQNSVEKIIKSEGGVSKIEQNKNKRQINEL